METTCCVHSRTLWDSKERRARPVRCNSWKSPAERFLLLHSPKKQTVLFFFTKKEKTWEMVLPDLTIGSKWRQRISSFSGSEFKWLPPAALPQTTERPFGHIGTYLVLSIWFLSGKDTLRAVLLLNVKGASRNVRKPSCLRIFFER